MLWASFVPTIFPDGDVTKKPLTGVYCELIRHELLKAKCEELLGDYNLMSGAKMNLVLFMNALEHIVKIVRIFTTPFGHALLCGVGGSGRKSLATLASYIAGYPMLNID